MATPEYYKNNRESCIARAKNWSENNREKVKINHKRWVTDNWNKVKLNQENYRKNNPKKYLFSLAKRRAIKKEQDFTITLEDLPDIPVMCPLLEIPIDSYSLESKYHPSIDRIDSSKGYIPGNIQFISQRANMLKNNCVAEELLLLAINLMSIEDSKK